MKLVILVIFLIFSIQHLTIADDTNSNSEICVDLGFEVESEKYIKCKLDLKNYYNNRTKDGKILKDKLIQKSQNKNMNIDFGCFNRCKDSVKGMTISLVESFCKKQCKID